MGSTPSCALPQRQMAALGCFLGWGALELSDLLGTARVGFADCVWYERA